MTAETNKIIQRDGLNCKLTSTIESQLINQEYKLKMNEIKSGYKIPGFRPGKVPAKLLDARFGKALLKEIAHEAIQQALNKALEAEKTTPATAPKIDVDEPKLGHELHYNVSFECFPQVDEKDIEGISVADVKINPNKSDIDDYKQSLISKHQSWKSTKTDEPLAQGFKVKTDFIGSLDGEPFEGGTANDYEFVLDTKTMLPAFESHVLSKRVGDKVEKAEVVFPKDYYRDDLRGKKAYFDIHIKEAWRPESQPKVNDILKKMGSEAKTWKEYEPDMKEELQDQASKLRHRIVKGRIVKQIKDGFNLDMPQTVLQSEVEALKKQAKNTNDDFEKIAKGNITLSLVLKKIIDDSGITVTESDLDKAISDMMPGMAQAAQLIAWYKSDENRVNQLRMRLLEEKAMDYLIEKSAAESGESYNIDAAIKLADKES
ncbi:MAG: trigger factor [Pseudomonadota bacterium]|nr:trigger factor [Pseudomonadota bacterium]